MQDDQNTNDREAERDTMVRTQIESRGIKDARVLAALRSVPRHRFVPKDAQKMAYADSPLPIGPNQTISQPYIVAYMSEAAKIRPTDRVLEIGTGSGYQAAILGQLAESVFTVEIIESLGRSAEEALSGLGYKNVHVKAADGYKGWPEAGPFDVIFVTAAPDRIPEPLVSQLKKGGRIIIPIGEKRQELIRLTKADKGLEKESLLPVSFVPMTGIVTKKPSK